MPVRVWLDDELLAWLGRPVRPRIAPSQDQDSRYLVVAIRPVRTLVLARFTDRPVPPRAGDQPGFSDSGFSMWAAAAPSVPVFAQVWVGWVVGEP